MGGRFVVLKLIDRRDVPRRWLYWAALIRPSLKLCILMKNKVLILKGNRLPYEYEFCGRKRVNHGITTFNSGVSVWLQYHDNITAITLIPCNTTFFFSILARGPDICLYAEATGNKSVCNEIRLFFGVQALQGLKSLPAFMYILLFLSLTFPSSPLLCTRAQARISIPLCLTG